MNLRIYDWKIEFRQENPAWGGRSATVTPNGWSDIPADFVTPNDGFDFSPAKTSHVTDSGSGSTNPAIEEAYPFVRWIPTIENDMFSRSQWQTAYYAHANHPPAVVVPIEEQNICAAPGQPVFLQGFAADPGDRKLTGSDSSASLVTPATSVTKRMIVFICINYADPFFASIHSTHKNCYVPVI
jgi:hypothetical protein